MFGLGAQEILWIFVIVLILFGGRKIPEMMRGVGQGLREFRRISQQATDELKDLTDPGPESDKDQHYV